MVQLSTLQMTVFIQQRPSIWATSQLISSEQFKRGSCLLKSNLSAFDYITPPSPLHICPICPSKECSLQNSHSCFATQCMNAPSSHNMRISSVCNSTTYAQKVSSPALIKIPPNSLSFLSLGLQVTEKQQCFIWPTELPPGGYLTIQSTSVSCQATNPAVPVHLTSSKLHLVHQLAACSGDVCLCNGKLLNQEIHEVSEATNHSKHIPSEPKKP